MAGARLHSDEKRLAASDLGFEKGCVRLRCLCTGMCASRRNIQASTREYKIRERETMLRMKRVDPKLYRNESRPTASCDDAGEVEDGVTDGSTIGIIFTTCSTSAPLFAWI
jgi:hypothetical protein